MNVPHTSAPHLAGKDERVHALLTQAGAEFATAAHFLNEYNISNELAQQAADLLEDPLLGCYKLHESLQEGAFILLNRVVLGYIRSVAADATVTGLWRVKKDNSSCLEYTIALKENTLDNRALFREFRLDYEEGGFGDLVPLVFHLIPESLSSGIVMSEEVAFA